jgi:hypothetical protein
LPAPSILNSVEEDSTTIVVVFAHILGLVELLLIEGVFWRMVFILFKEPRYIWSIISLKISINVRRIGIGVALIVLFIKSALKVRLLTVVARRVIRRLVRAHIELLG